MRTSIDLVYVVKRCFHPYAKAGNALPYVAEIGTVLLVPAKTTLAEDDNPKDVPDTASIEGMIDSIIIIDVTWSIKMNRIAWSDMVYGPFSAEEYRKGIWYIAGISVLHNDHLEADIHRAGCGIVLTPKQIPRSKLPTDFGTNGNTFGCLRPVYEERTNQKDAPYQLKSLEKVEALHVESVMMFP